MPAAISRSGDNSEEIYRRLTGAVKPARAALGDAQLGEHFIEIKAVGSNTLNQVRAVKYSTLIAHDTRHDHWYVIPAHIVVTLIARTKTRGQHTENPFESATLSLPALAAYRIDHARDLLPATAAAITESQRYPQIRALMEQIVIRSKTAAQRSRSSVQAATAFVDLPVDQPAA